MALTLFFETISKKFSISDWINSNIFGKKSFLTVPSHDIDDDDVKHERERVQVGIVRVHFQGDCFP